MQSTLIQAYIAMPHDIWQAHRFCTLIIRTGDDAFDLLISALNKAEQWHIADELQRIEREGYVQIGSIVATLNASMQGSFARMW